jgi:hypothetical protein
LGLLLLCFLAANPPCPHQHELIILVIFLRWIKEAGVGECPAQCLVEAHRGESGLIRAYHQQSSNSISLQPSRGCASVTVAAMAEQRILGKDKESPIAEAVSCACCSTYDK